jgi:LuxR family maltose regulon positive regulatory protein
MMEITGLTLHTIRTHTMGAYKKLGVDNAADAVLKAKLLGIIN